MTRIIINNNAGLAELEALQVIQSVVSDGRISDDGNQFCYATAFKCDDPTQPDVVVYASRTRQGTDTFTIEREKRLTT